MPLVDRVVVGAAIQVKEFTKDHFIQLLLPTCRFSFQSKNLDSKA